MLFDSHLKSYDLVKAAGESPALPPPAGVVSNFADPSNASIAVQILNPILLSLVTLALILRSYSKFFVVKTVDFDDIYIVLGYGSYIVYIYEVYYVTNTIGFFVHTWDVTVSEVSDAQHHLQYAATFYVISLAFTKIAILLQWIRIFAPAGTRGVFYWCCKILLWIIFLFYLSTNVAGNLICVPFERIWDKTVPGVCYVGRTLNLSVGVFNLVTDLLLLILPQKLIWSLNVSTRRKIGIALTFATGLIAIGAAAFRLGVTFAYVSDPDWLFHVSALSVGCITEMSAILLVYFMPGIPKAFGETGIFRKLNTSLKSLVVRTSHSPTGIDSASESKKGFGGSIHSQDIESGREPPENSEGSQHAATLDDLSSLHERT
ncbi:hypothetical protein F5Y14DRAFT_406085 [Nemania sp. NC0429]|nr:hypothetical protein F5Y14DRAFT_406085 [Nemania sp. NC0429]